MKLNNLNNAVHFLLDNEPVNYSAAYRDETTDFIDKEFMSLKPLFRKKIQFVNKSFQEFFSKERPKLPFVLRQESIKQSGTVIIPVHENGHLTIFYDLDSGDDNIGNGKWTMSGCIIAFATSREFLEPGLLFCHRLNNGNGISYFANEHILGAWEDTPHEHIYHFIDLVLFPHFFETEVTIVPAGKEVLHKNVKYLNETKLPIEILNLISPPTIIQNRN